MATFFDRYPRNVPGKYYIDVLCTDCDLCREYAPKNIRRDDDCGYSYVFKQPDTEEEISACERGVQGCPTAGVGNDGSEIEFYSAPIRDWALYSERLQSPMKNFADIRNG